MACSISPPESLLIPLDVPSKLLMGPGPSNCPERILSASSQQMLSPLDEDLLKIMVDVKKGIQYAFQTTNRMTFAVSGTGHCAMEAAICNLLEPDDVFLIASSGIWGDRAQDIAERLGAKCFKMTASLNCAVDLKNLEKIIGKINPKVTFICHGDSSTGVLQPLDRIADILRKYNCLFLVDAVASLGAAPLFMDKLGIFSQLAKMSYISCCEELGAVFSIDVLYSGSQKILNAPPGLSPISFSPRAMEKIKARKTPVKSFYMDCLQVGNYWRCDDGPVIYHHTAPVNLVYALREALAILAQETLEKSWEKHKYHVEVLYKRLEEMGLTLFVTEKAHRLPSVTTVEIPKQINGLKVAESMRKRFGVDIAGGLGPTSGKVWRIGLMGYNCTAENVSKTADALSKCIHDFKLQSNL